MEITITITKYQAELLRRAIAGHVEALDDYFDHGLKSSPKELSSLTYERKQCNTLDNILENKLLNA